jgi:hypothetical protein
VPHSRLRGEIQVTLKNSVVAPRYVNCKVNIKLSLYLIKHRSMKAYEGGHIAPRELNLGIS